MTLIAATVLVLVALIAGLVWFAASTARKVETAVPPRGRFMEIDGERIHYVDTGGPGHRRHDPYPRRPPRIIYGKSDRLLDYRRHGEAMRLSCPVLDLDLVDGGHMLHVTASDRCAALIRRIAMRQEDDLRGTRANAPRQHALN